MQRRRSGNRRNNLIPFMSTLYNLLAESESNLQDIIQLFIFMKQKVFHSHRKYFVSF